MNVKKGQNLIEYILIFAVVALLAYAFISRIDLRTIRNYVFVRSPSATNPSQIEIEPMTDDN